MKDYDIANLTKDNPNRAVDACREMLMMWLKVIPSPTWGKLDDAIKSMMMVSMQTPRGKHITVSVIFNTYFNQLLKYLIAAF